MRARTELVGDRLVVERSACDSQVAPDQAACQLREALPDRVRAAKVASRARDEAAAPRGTPRRFDERARGRIAVDRPVERVQRAGRRPASDEGVPQRVRVDEGRRGTAACSFELAERLVERHLRLRLGTALLVEARGRRRARPWMEDAEGVVGLLKLAACHLGNEPGEGAGEGRFAVQLVAGRGRTPRVVGAKGVARPSPPDPRSQAECAEDDRDEAPRAVAAPRRVNALGAATCAIGQLGTTVLTEP